MDDTQKKILALGILGIGAYIFYAKKASAAELPAPAPELPSPEPAKLDVVPAPPKPRAVPSGPGPLDVKTLQQRLNWLRNAVLSESVDPVKAGLAASDLPITGNMGPQTTAALQGAFKLIAEVFRIKPGTALTADHAFFTAIATSLGGADKLTDAKNTDALARALTKYTAQMSTADRAAIKAAAGGLAYQKDEDESVPGYASAKDSGRVGQASASPETEKFQRQINSLYDTILSLSGISIANLNAAGVRKIDFSKGGVGVFGPQTRQARDGMFRLFKEVSRLSNNPVLGLSQSDYSNQLGYEKFVKAVASTKINANMLSPAMRQFFVTAVKNLSSPMTPVLTERFV